MNLFGESESANQLTRLIVAGINGMAASDKYLNYDRTDGNVILNLPKISDLIDALSRSGNFTTIDFILSDVTPSPSANALIINSNPTDNINGLSSFTTNTILNFVLQATPSGWLAVQMVPTPTPPIPNNPYDFYLDGNVVTGGDGSIENPFKTITELNNAVLALPKNKNYVANISPFEGYGAEVVGDLDLAENLSMIGVFAPSTTFDCTIRLTASGSFVIVSQFIGIGFNTAFILDLDLAPAAFISILQSSIIINRIDNNNLGLVTLLGGILGVTVEGGELIIKDGYIFGTITINEGATVYCSNSIFKGGSFILTGACSLKTLSMYNPYPNYVTGIVDGSGTPDWFTDAASNEAFGGTLNKTVY